ncbi:LrgB family protein [Halosquirtibacter laminarini]|uniref:LrgB family protein n=1 Tax=Halosquirtibacter laminarini TaxID=3374600 RepID=A0AC61NNK9_9BACT|nr:LrgB family protein [Prolixibacteraceae bacterium]
MEFLNSISFLVAFTMIVFILAKLIYQKYPIFIFNPVFLSMGVCIGFLLMTNIPYSDYSAKTKFISFWLNPSVVALAIPFYLQLERIKRDWKRILSAMVLGSLSGIISVVLIAFLCGASKQVYLSLAAKSVTTPIAMGVTEALGGIPALTAGIVVAVGILGAIVGEAFMNLLGVTNAKSQGMAIGTASHALGTAKIAPKSEQHGAYSALGLAMNGVLTAIFAPIIMPWIEKLLELIS